MNNPGASSSDGSLEYEIPDPGKGWGGVPA